ncbi:MAG: hypothetical protein IJ343_13675 [Clostridia bacterium]|nr:hypothetical protein [Clostridia bacterium]
MIELNMKNEFALQHLLVVKEKLPLRLAGALAMSVFHEYDEHIREGFLLWMEDQLPEDFQSGKYKLNRLMQTTGATQVEALCMMNVFAKQPENMKAVKWVQKKEKLDVKV